MRYGLKMRIKLMYELLAYEQEWD